MENMYIRYKSLDYFIRSEDRMFNLNKKTPKNISSIIYSNFGIELSDDSRIVQYDNIIIVSSDNVIIREYIQLNNEKVLLLVLPDSIRNDEYSIENKISTLFKALYDGPRRGKSIYDYQLSLIPFIATTMIMGDMYAPYSQLIDTIINTLLVDINDNDRKEIITVMDYIHSLTSDYDKNNLFSNSGIFSIINKNVASLIVDSYKPLNN